jgi:hypothetical protein
MGHANTGGTVTLSIGVILLIAWLLGFLLLKKVVGAAIHLLLIIAIVAIAWHFIGPHMGPLTKQ